jgi:hypothetical protein
MRGFYVRAQFGIIARLEASVAFFAEALRHLGDESSLDERRVKAILILANPAQAVQLLQAFAAWKDRPADPPMPPEDEPAPAASSEDENPTGDKPTIDWSQLLPTVVTYIHLYGGLDTEGIARVEGLGPLTESWIHQHLGKHAKFKVTPVLDLAGQAPVDAYEIPDRHRQAVHLMTPADIFPFASNLTRFKDVDHTEAFDHDAAEEGSGQSRVGNYGPMTKFHHRVKTHGKWQVKQPFPGIYLWRDPHGAFYLVDHTGTRRTQPSRPESRLEAEFSQFVIQHAA